MATELYKYPVKTTTDVIMIIVGQLEKRSAPLPRNSIPSRRPLPIIRFPMCVSGYGTTVKTSNL